MVHAGHHLRDLGPVQKLSAVATGSGCMKLTEPPFATASTSIAYVAADLRGGHRAILISDMPDGSESGPGQEGAITSVP